MLPFVSKPGRYIGNEINSVRKNLKDVDVRFALVFPDIYEIGMSYMGFSILYHILNQQEGVFAERAFAPWPNMEARMRELKMPLFSLETFSPLNEFDVFGLTFQYELHFPTMLNLLDLAGIPVESREREGFPLVIGGGPSAFNPEPVADFMDAVVIGDGEEVVLKIVQVIRRAKMEGWSRRDCLRALARVDGVYVPQFYEAHYDDCGNFLSLGAIDEAAKNKIRAQTVSELKPGYYPEKPLVPMIQTTHDRVSLEIARGCSRGCRFCNAGMIYRPVRQRSPQDLLAQAQKNIEATGYEEISLVSLSTSDYTRLSELMHALAAAFTKDNVNISFPSLRPESFTPQVARFARGVRKSGLTLAPEAGSQRLRDVINKATSAPELLRAVDLAFSEGWNTVKLYFMIGHPTETDEDLFGLVELVDQVRRIASRYRGRINLSISPFIPKPLTPFQWVAQDSMEETRRKLNLLMEKIRWKNVKLNRRDPETAFVEGLLARGDRRVGRVIKRVWELGARLEGWSEFFEFERYTTALQENGLTFEQFLQEKNVKQPLPWQHIDKGVTSKFLQDEYERALGQEQTPDCRFSVCNKCGLMGQKACRDLIAAQERGERGEQPIEATENDPIADAPAAMPMDRAVQTVCHVRIHYSRGEEVRYLSHLDLLRLIERVLQRSRLPIVFTEGFNPHAKLTFGPPLTTGLTSDAEYLDLHFYGDETFDIGGLLAQHLPEGIKIIQVKYSAQRMTALAAVISRADYLFRLEDVSVDFALNDRIQAILNSKELLIERKKEKATRLLDVRPFIVDMEAVDEGLRVRTKADAGKSVRIDELLSLLFPESETLAKTTRVHRLKMWIHDGERLLDPMEVFHLSENHNIN